MPEQLQIDSCMTHIDTRRSARRNLRFVAETALIGESCDS
ncbi:MAG: hypothetical protein RLY29_455 [Actinomycetota bacterium]